MNAYVANVLNAVVLIGMSLWGYLSSESPSATALIPVAFGIILLILSNGVKKENKIVAHVAVVLTLLILISLFKPLSAALGRSDNMAMMRLAVMIVTSLIAMIYFIKSFIDARKARAQS